jgi:hypothetical protein
MNIEYNKVEENTPEVVTLARQLGATPKSVAAMINQDRYRKAYNKVKQERDKEMRAFFKAHPELLPKGE